MDFVRNNENPKSWISMFDTLIGDVQDGRQMVTRMEYLKKQ